MKKGRSSRPTKRLSRERVKGFEPSTFSLGRTDVGSARDAAESGQERPEGPPTRETKIEDDAVTGTSFD
jgi:hypothetical protein